MASGAHELAGIVLSIFLSVLAVIQIIRHRKLQRDILLISAICIAGTALSVFAPGNAVRAEYSFGPTPGLETRVNSFLLLILPLGRTAMTPTLLLAAAIALIPNPIADFIKERFRSHKTIFLDIFVSVSIAILGACSIYAIKIADHPEPRTVSLLVNIELLVMIPALLVLLLQHDFSFSLRNSMAFRNILYVFLSFSLILGGFLDKGFFSYKKGLPAWLAYSENRHAILTKLVLSGETVVSIPAGPPPPLLLFMGADLTTDPDHWINRGTADYYGFSSLKLDEH